MTKSRAIITVESEYCQNSYGNLWAQRALPCIHCLCVFDYCSLCLQLKHNFILL